MVSKVTELVHQKKREKKRKSVDFSNGVNKP